MKSKITIEDIRAFAISKGGECLSNEFINNRTKLQWQCGNGHIWFATRDCVINAGSWCAVCYKNNIYKHSHI